jgi:type III secretion protein R
MSCLSAIAVTSPDPSPALVSRPVLLFLVVAAMSVLPLVVLLMTSFVKIVIVLSILKSAFGSSQIPPSQIVTGLALLLTLFIMAPTGERMFQAIEHDLGPKTGADLLSGQTVFALVTAADKAKEPVREFLLRHGSPSDRRTFFNLALRMRNERERAGISERDFLIAAPAFLATELRRAFEIGCLILLPFLVIDLVVANLLVALGMHMLSPTAVSLPFKLLLFVLADGWQLLLRGLVASYV